jgi:hypothetical protein
MCVQNHTQTVDNDVYLRQRASSERRPPTRITLELSGRTAKPLPYAPNPCTVATCRQSVQSLGDTAHTSSNWQGRGVMVADGDTAIEGVVDADGESDGELLTAGVPVVVQVCDGDGVCDGDAVTEDSATVADPDLDAEAGGAAELELCDDGNRRDDDGEGDGDGDNDSDCEGDSVAVPRAVGGIDGGSVTTTDSRDGHGDGRSSCESEVELLVWSCPFRSCCGTTSPETRHNASRHVALLSQEPKIQALSVSSTASTTTTLHVPSPFGGLASHPSSTGFRATGWR